MQITKKEDEVIAVETSRNSKNAARESRLSFAADVLFLALMAVAVAWPLLPVTGTVALRSFPVNVDTALVGRALAAAFVVCVGAVYVMARRRK